MRTALLSVIVCIGAIVYFVTRDIPLSSVNRMMPVETIEQASVTSMTYFANAPHYTYNLTADEIAELKQVLAQVKLKRHFFYNETNVKHFVIIQTAYDNEILTLTDDGQMKIGFDETFVITNDVLQQFLKQLAHRVDDKS